jgi:alkanesulfonate monooxygenase SsuD/methylene tetrahydromethanopterin reductase-like flavin-dependent oxidoreductase (luciferase family)
MSAMSYLAVSAIQAAGIVPITLPPPKDYVERLREAIALVKGLWSEGPFTFSGMHYTITEMDGWPKPLQLPNAPSPTTGAQPPSR